MKSLLAYASLALLSSAAITQEAAKRPTILVTAGNETETSTSVSGAATKVGGVAVGAAASDTSTYEHSEIWEVVRRFSAECPAATFVVNPETPHTLTIHTDYEKAPTLVGKIILYQLSLLDAWHNPLYISKKNYLYREIKPICRAIQSATR
jgi:hypothetical protein